MWRDLVAGLRSREEVHRWVAPWVEDRWADVSDPPTMTALETLHGFDMTYDLSRPRVVRHGPGDRYVHSSRVIADQLDRWLEACQRYDVHPGAGWRI